jgi:hypothetical protein
VTDLATLRSACSQTGIEVVASLAQHRILSTAQVRTIHLPDRSYRWAQKLLARLGEAELAGYIETPYGTPRRLWHVTEHGARLTREAGVLDGEPRLIGAEDAAGALQAHTLAVNDSAICFLSTARERGDEFGPFAWRQEVSHPLNYGRGRRRRALIADAVFTYLRLDGSGVAIEQRFLEIDRATLSVDRLAAELVRYAELYRLAGGDGEPLWRLRYPVFPPVHCVLAGGSRGVLERRRSPPSPCCEAIPSSPARRRWRSPSACSRTSRQKARSPRSSATSATPSSRPTGWEADLAALLHRADLLSIVEQGLRPDRSRGAGDGRAKRRPSHDRRAATPVDDLKVRVSIEQAPPGSALDDQLRREQAKAIFDLLLAYQRAKADRKGQECTR